MAVGRGKGFPVHLHGLVDTVCQLPGEVVANTDVAGD